MFSPSQDLDSDLTRLLHATRLVAFDFDGVFTDNMVYVSEEGQEWVRCYRGDGLGLRKLERLGISTIVLSTEVNPVVEVRCRKLKIPCVQGLEDKLSSLRNIVRDQGISLAEVAYVGNDINDLACLKEVGLPIVVQDAHPDVVPSARYQTRTSGGEGAVREVCDLFDFVRGASPERSQVASSNVD